MEHILTPKVENVKLVDKFNAKASPLGTLYLTTTHLIFVSNASASAPMAAPPPEPPNPMGEGAGASGGGGATNLGGFVHGGAKKELWILHTLMHTVEKPLLTTSGTQLRILCSHFQSASFIIQRDRDAHDVYLSLMALSKPKEFKDLYCFTYNPTGQVQKSTGWFFHDLDAEYQRMGVPNENWTLCSMNDQHRLCPTYPQKIFIPILASQAIIEGSSRFRSKGRLPVLTYLHKNNAAIVRCAQPLVGISGVRSSYDEKYVECLRKATPRSPFIYVIDTRPAMNAMANRAGGKGYENEKYYENINFSFKGIENIHKMRSSLKAMMTSVANATTMEGFMSELANSSWLKHVKAVLDASVAIKNCILEGKSVIVHCSDGWDRTSQTCALACLMLDGYYRTFQGFQALIEKDWLAFGHKFTDRCGHLDGDPNEVSPNFTQFLDAVWQLTQLSPQLFQFNERYLITIHEHVYSCQYGTFIGNSERERELLGLREKTYSLWGYLTANYDDYTNPLYERSTQMEVMRPTTAPQNIKFWSGLFCRFESGAHTREPIIDLLSVTQNHTTSLEDHGRQLSKTIGQMTSLIANAKATGAMRRMLPTSPSNKPSVTESETSLTSSSSSSTISHPLQMSSNAANADFEHMEKKFTDLKASIMEQCQSSKQRFLGFLSLKLPQSIAGLHSTTPSKVTPPISKEKAIKNDSSQRATSSSPQFIPMSEAEFNSDVVLSKELLEAEIDSVAVDWKSLRSSLTCPCGFRLDDNATTKIHCRRCGCVFCKRCIHRKVPLPGHLSKKPMPLCSTCCKLIDYPTPDSDDEPDEMNALDAFEELNSMT
ncbi:myotubularin-related protein 6-like [Tigriopus californicus]|uniref:myotubularin-related protein 6-like n=1 Tax=Tigriopus californicus TaxID=6832 RepID=UPI0027DAB468|nr:myotubularin-related protein 6-like [Tigriopus californicus]